MRAAVVPIIGKLLEDEEQRPRPPLIHRHGRHAIVPRKPAQQRDDHRVGLVRLLTIALRVLTVLEGVIRQNLEKQKRELSGLYAGNPKRRTNQPTAERLLEAFSEVTLTIVRTSEFIQRHITPLSSLQKDILALLGFTPAIYLQLTDDS